MKILKHNEMYRGYLIEIFQVQSEITYPYQLEINKNNYYFVPSIFNGIELAKEFIHGLILRKK